MGQAVVGQLADYLRAALQGEELPVYHGIGPDEMAAQLDAEWGGNFAAEGNGAGLELLQEYIEKAHHIHHPGYIGHQVAAPLPVATLGEMLLAFLNNGSAIYEMGPAHVICEQRVVRFLCGLVGWEADGWGEASDGFLTHGGSVGNLTALLAARQAKAGTDVWKDGQSEPFAFLASAQNHYCVDRAVRIMGWGAGGIENVRVDDHYRMDVSDLAGALERARSRGRTVLGVVASACTTSTGSFDPIGPIAEFCQANDLWLHVDAAHGGSFLLHEEYRQLLAGIQHADSVVWDMHKMMLMPALNTAVLFREGGRSYEAFAQEASYLFGSERPEEQWYNLGQRTLECTKRGLGAVPYLLLRHYGTQLFVDYLESMMVLAKGFADRIRERACFELAVEPECNIVCFRRIPIEGSEGHLASDLQKQNEWQLRLRAAALASGETYLVQTTLDGRVFLRVTLIHPFTDLPRLERLLAFLAQA